MLYLKIIMYFIFLYIYFLYLIFHEMYISLAIFDVN